MIGIIDRKEETFWVIELENGDFINISQNNVALDLVVEEGDVVEISNQHIVSVNRDETLARRKQIESLMDDLFEV